VTSYGVQGRLHEIIRGEVFIDDENLTEVPALPLEEVQWEAPLPRPGKIIGAPANYYEHIDEMPNSATILDWGFFLNAPTSVVGRGDRIRLPCDDKRTDYGGELGGVIGRGGRNIPLEDAMDHVYGYTCGLDITVRSSEDR